MSRQVGRAGRILLDEFRGPTEADGTELVDPRWRQRSVSRAPRRGQRRTPGTARLPGLPSASTSATVTPRGAPGPRMPNRTSSWNRRRADRQRSTPAGAAQWSWRPPAGSDTTGGHHPRVLAKGTRGAAAPGAQAFTPGATTAARHAGTAGSQCFPPSNSATHAGIGMIVKDGPEQTRHRVPPRTSSTCSAGRQPSGR
jgi:hypothetical protein